MLWLGHLGWESRKGEKKKVVEGEARMVRCWRVEQRVFGTQIAVAATSRSAGSMWQSKGSIPFLLGSSEVALVVVTSGLKVAGSQSYWQHLGQLGPEKRVVGSLQLKEEVGIPSKKLKMKRELCLAQRAFPFRHSKAESQWKEKTCPWSWHWVQRG